MWHCKRTFASWTFKKKSPSLHSEMLGESWSQGEDEQKQSQNPDSKEDARVSQHRP